MSSSTASLDGDVIVITSPFGKELKEMGARWDSRRSAWTLPATRMNAAVLNDAALGLPDLRGALVPPQGALADTRLFDYQRAAGHRLVASPHGQLLTLSPGLGKTATAIVAADAAVPNDRIVVVAPASLLRTWEREIRKWSTVPGDIYVMTGKVDFEAAHYARWIIVSWDKAVREAATWGKGWPLWILDESVLVKSRQSKRFKALVKVRKDIDRVWLLSGNPATKHADDLWAQFHLIWPNAFPSYWRFAERYCVIEETPWARVVAGTRGGRDAAGDNADLMLVVNQEDVLDLPEYLFDAIDVYLDGKQARAYDSMLKTFVAELSTGQEIVTENEAAQLTKLQQIASFWDGESAKHDALLELLPTYEAPYLIWTHWKEGARALAERLRATQLRVAQVDGDTPAARRDADLEAFKAGNLDALVLSLGVGKFGHTFTQTKTIFYVDKSWAADDYFQSLHRVRRIGLTHRPVVVTLRAPGTVDELVEANLEGKLGSISRMTKAHLATLLKGLGR